MKNTDCHYYCWESLADFTLIWMNTTDWQSPLLLLLSPVSLLLQTPLPGDGEGLLVAVLVPDHALPAAPVLGLVPRLADHNLNKQGLWADWLTRSGHPASLRTVWNVHNIMTFLSSSCMEQLVSQYVLLCLSSLCRQKSDIMWTNLCSSNQRSHLCNPTLHKMLNTNSKTFLSLCNSDV